MHRRPAADLKSEIRNQKSDCDWNEPVCPGRYCSCTHSPNYVCSPHWRGMPCPAHRYDTLLSACIYIGAIEPSARVPDTNLSLPYTPSRSASLPLRSSHTLAYIFTVRGCAACASTTIHIAHRHHVALSGRQLPSHSVVAPLTRTVSAGVMRTVVAWWHASPIHVARHTLPSWQCHKSCHTMPVGT